LNQKNLCEDSIKALEFVYVLTSWRSAITQLFENSTYSKKQGIEMTRSLFSFLFIAFLGTFIAGCGESEEGAPVLHPVTGKLTVGGTAVGNVQVALMPTGGTGRAAIGNTDAEGNFTIASPNAGAGAVAGEYKVVLTPSATGTMESQYAGGGDPSKAAAEESSIPKEYLSAETTTKTVEVKEGENQINLEL
jgi:hypothetical protein